MEQQAVNVVADEIAELSEYLLTVAVADGHYRESLVSHIRLTVDERDLDALRVYRNMTLQDGFDQTKMTFKYADYAIMILHDQRHEETAGILTPDRLRAFQTVVQARQQALDDRHWIMGDGNHKLLLLMIEKPEAEAILLHLIRDRNITGIDSLLEQVHEGLSLPLPMNHGAL